jgi:hypothetical protein
MHYDTISNCYPKLALNDEENRKLIIKAGKSKCKRQEMTMAVQKKLNNQRLKFQGRPTVIILATYCTSKKAN